MIFLLALQRICELTLFDDPAMTQKVPIVFFALPLVFVIIGGWVSFRALRGQLDALFSSSWSTTSGHILDSSIESKRGRKGAMRYEVKVTYQYSVGGEDFTGTRIHPTYVSDWHQDSHEQLHRRLAPRSVVKVYYRPTSPSQSYLATGFISTGFLPLLFGLIFLGAGLAFGAMMWLIRYGDHDYVRLIGPP
ncbi:DUF3592 domain-containing protein [Verrucomicrobium sp. BvORR034]|uniref:DUF3592 domain-containing protein n=1 Tax=Verrucomicrobium sp. BvORR034 TaxID=1396418 RepID=UPI002240FECA|nr:DUF3592 domain-containing protein [Verrucomicrobium sp. BvORR034]